ncbi:hypothetical protein A5666_19265 [Mycolicibacterium fortuitum]|uniref:hypothetical protein n=1 Tax=Mycolicibacterium fortuitum TaxID=1766 RepID=UPI0007EB1EBD|nr:hypothetical protein [Mycolicibacterium fortuitum]OBA94557.1 hypothetical protein A5665_07230 [Mycolicibacterium fortuitum]OBI58473.1 hypothetical protein A5666_19265 [Mycolicibacterium fortuitum]
MAISTPWLILRCKWKGTDAEPLSDTYFENMFTAAGAGTHNMVEFFDRMSHGTLDLTGSKVSAWISLPYEQADYVGNVSTAPQGKINRTGLVEAARQAADDAGYSTADFTGAVIVMNTATDLFGQQNGWAAVCDSTNVHPALLGQEMGHVYGLDHSRRADQPDADYLDDWDVMSTWGSCHINTVGPYGAWGPGLNAANMRGRGWLDRARVKSMSTDAFTSASVELRPLHARELPGYLALEVGDFIIEYRDRSGWDSAVPEPVVLVHSFVDNHSVLQPSHRGSYGLTAGDVWSPWPDTRDLPYFQVHVDAIDEASRTATLSFSGHAGRDLQGEIPVGGNLGLPWVDGGGFIGLDGHVLVVTRGDAIVDSLRQLISLHLAETVTDSKLRANLQRQSLTELSRFVDTRRRILFPGAVSTIRTPAPRTTEFPVSRR